MHQQLPLQRFKVTALKPVETYVEATDITVAGLQAVLECARDGVRLLSVEPAGAAEPISHEFDWPALVQLRKQDGHY